MKIKLSRAWAVCNVMRQAPRYAATYRMQASDGDTRRRCAGKVHHRTGDSLLAERKESPDAYTCAIF